MVDQLHALRAQRSMFAIEANGINVIHGHHRRGAARELFWPWFGANVSVLALSYGAFALGFGISFWQALFAGLFGIAFSFLLCGLVALAGKRGSAPTMLLSRAPFGVRGNRLPAAISWVLTVGWETVLTILATLATAAVFAELGWGGGTLTKAVALAVVCALIVVVGVVGFDLIMRLETAITVVTAVLTVIYILVVMDDVSWSAVSAMPSGSTQQVIGATVFLMTGFGLGWVNLAADYSRYLPRSTSSGGVVGWTTFGGAIAPIVLFTFGLMLAGSSADLSERIAADPIGALAQALPSWFLLPFAIVAVLGLVGGAVLDIYSSGLAMLAAGIRVRRHIAALIDGIVMVLGTIYVVFLADDTFLTLFMGFLITLGVPIAAWCGIMLADIASRRRDYEDTELFNPNGRYGNIQWLPIRIMVLSTAIGWGLVTNAQATWLAWQGYLLDALGLGGKNGEWAFANLGVLFALAASFLLQFALGRSRVRRQEAGQLPQHRPPSMSRPHVDRRRVAALLRGAARAIDISGTGVPPRRYDPAAVMDRALRAYELESGALDRSSDLSDLRAATLRAVVMSRSSPAPGTAAGALTPKELRIVSMLLSGASTRAIATTEQLAPGTVRAELRRILDKWSASANQTSDQDDRDQ